MKNIVFDGPCHGLMKREESNNVGVMEGREWMIIGWKIDGILGEGKDRLSHKTKQMNSIIILFS